MLLIGIGASAQHHHQHGKQQMLREFTPEQQASLKSRKMTLELALDDTQQEKVESLLSRHFQQRSEQRASRDGQMDTLSRRNPEDHYRKLSQRLDHQIAFQRELKEILSPSQFEQWQHQRLARTNRHRNRRGRH